MTTTETHDPLGEPVEFQGPMQPHHDVVVYGRLIPHLTAFPWQDGAQRWIHLVVDNRHAVDLTLAEAQRVIPFMAHCIAVGAGYTGLPDDPDTPMHSRPLFNRVFTVVAETYHDHPLPDDAA